jgi:SOS-response transcriptional repressor LexA
MDRDAALRKRQGNRLKKAREQAGWKFGRSAAIDNGWPESSYRAHERGTRTIGQDDAEKYARRFRAEGVEITAQDILFDDASQRDDDRPLRPDIVLVPQLSWVAASKMTDVGEALHPAHAPTIPFADLPAGDYFALKVAGDSMDRVAPDGSTILVNRRDRRLISNRYYVFGNRGEATFKRYIASPTKLLMPFSNNPTHAPLVPGKGLSVIGRVYRVLVDL